ncbi:MAG: bifunctional adenosylcobinamide kinase/adenosylcobinamide-phosphate guanylyltransferase [Blautia sp.]|nr:bifunctional adenosylcobinamide kinase/adenosylcobinamide-phosphate guanylyltransferase [Lachnoclostridium sp.]MCM1210770.1 bifunctional adenosylcobinamide kinase/adenosylcobinamide-phosphate guanylyltransferase [Blautia sp.]
MMVLILGGSGSGKSGYAEKIAVSLARRTMPGYYLATMQVWDDEGRRKVENHRKLRDGKGFLTIEQPTDISQALEKMQPGEKVALLECISNLAANEMFSPEGAQSEEKLAAQLEMQVEEAAGKPVQLEMQLEEAAAGKPETQSEIQVTEKIVRDVALLKEKTTHLVVVSNNVFEDGVNYDAATMAYMRAMGRVNHELAVLTDWVIEVVAGIPLVVKEGKKEDAGDKIFSDSGFHVF